MIYFPQAENGPKGFLHLWVFIEDEDPIPNKVGDWCQIFHQR